MQSYLIKILNLLSQNEGFVVQSTVLIDEHAFGRNKKHNRKDFVTCFVDNNRKKLREMAPSRDYDDMKKAIEHIPGKEKVENVVMDMSPTFKAFATDYFPNAKITVDKFHVIRLIHPAIRKYRKDATGDKRSNPIRHLLLKNRKRLKPYQKRAVTRFCNENPNVNEVYRFLRRTLMKWRDEILRYFKTGHTNARIEGINRKCKLLQRCAYGFQNFGNYRLRALYSCS